MEVLRCTHKAHTCTWKSDGAEISAVLRKFSENKKKSKSKVQKKKFLSFSKITCPYILLVKTILRQQYPAYLWRIFCQAWFFKNCYIFVKKKLIKKYDFHNFQLCAVWVHILFCLSKFIKMCSTYPYLFESLIMLSRMRLAPSETNLNYVKIMWFFTKVSRFRRHCREMILTILEFLEFLSCWILELIN